MKPEDFNGDRIPFSRLLGIVVTRTDADCVEARMPVRDDLCTGGGILHGGAIMSFADTLGAIATIVNLPEDAKGTATIESKTNFLRGAPLGTTVQGRSIPIHRGRTTQVWQTSIESEEGKPVALVTQTQIVFR